MKRSNIRRALKYGMGIFISVLSLSASLSSSQHALAAQGSPKLGSICFTYFGAIITSKSDNQVLTEHRRPASAGAPVDVEPANGSDKQEWDFVPVNPDASGCVYEILSLRTGKALTAHSVDSSVFLLGRNTGDTNQLWRIVLAPSAYAHVGFGYTTNYRNIYKIVSVESGKVLEVFGKSFIAGVPATLADSNDGCGHAQSWYIGLKLGIPSFVQVPLKPAFPGGLIGHTCPR